jgi:hypothetical protein
LAEQTQQTIALPEEIKEFTEPEQEQSILGQSMV